MAASEFVADTLPFTYIETLLVGERHHGAGVAAGLISALFAGVVRELGDFPDIVAMKTYTPKAYVLMRRFALGGDIVFSPDISRLPDGAESVQRATRLARFLSPECEFHPGTSVVRGGGGPITGRFWRYEPLCCDPAVNSFFRREVGDRDRMLCIVHAPTPEAKERLITALRIGQPITKTVRSHG